MQFFSIVGGLSECKLYKLFCFTLFYFYRPIQKATILKGPGAICIRVHKNLWKMSARNRKNCLLLLCPKSFRTAQSLYLLVSADDSP